MADLAFGISKTAIQLLADKVKKAIKEEAEQWQTVERDLVFITGEFEMMQSFLDTATEEHVKNKIVRTWVRQVRDLSNDVEDNIEFVLHLDTKKRSWWLRLLPSCVKTGGPLPVDQAVAETTMLRARVVDVSQRNIRYNLIVDSASKPMAAMDLVPVQKTAASSFDALINAAFKKSGLLGLARLNSREDRDLQVVSICGTEGDLVKVAIVRKMYSDSRIHKDFQCRAWVKLVHPFNPHEFLRSLMTQFFTHTCQEQEVIIGLHALERMQQTIQGDLDLIKEFAHTVNTYRYLIILEDLCTMVQWDAIRSYLPDKKNGSRIVVLTHHPVVASQCTGEPCRVLALGQFSPGHSVGVYYKEPQGFQHYRAQSFIKPEPHHSLFLGRDTEMDELFKKTQETRLISVWGMPGVGKSALIKAIYDDKLRTSDQFKWHAWVNVSHPFIPSDFCRSLLVSFHWESTSSERKCAMELGAEDLINKCRYHLSERVCLFVIDGVQSNEDWDWIKSNLIQYGDSRSSIIIITSEESVAKHCAVSIDGVYNVKGLDATAASKLFEKVFEEDGSFFIRMMEEDAKTSIAKAAEPILSKCGRLPRFIITVARYLANFVEEKRYMANFSTDVLEQEMRRLSDNFLQEVATDPVFDSLHRPLARMHSYWNSCPQGVKKCMLYLLIFPQDTIIRRRCLIKRWIAEGYCKSTDSNSMEKHAEKVFDEVAAKGIIVQPVRDGRQVNGYLVNVLFREFMSRLVEETIFSPVQVSVLEEKQRGRLTTEGIGQHLAIESTWEDNQVVFESLDLSRLRSLTVFNRRFRSFYVSDRMRVLRVLDLENAQEVSDSDFLKIGKLPSRLKFLSLRGQRQITSLPESVGDLLQLQTLDIRGTKIATLPPFITRLRKLQYIRAGTTVAWMDYEEGSPPPSTSSRSSTLLASCLPNKFPRSGRPVVGSRSGGVVVPRGIARLQALQALGTVCLNTADGESILREIISLPQLKKLQISDISALHVWILGVQHKGSHLESLTLESVTKDHFGIMRLLGFLPSLRTLRLRVNKDEDGSLPFPSTELLRKLQVVEIACKSKLHVWFVEGAMEKLEQLRVHCLEGSEMQISGLENPVSLKQVWLLGSFDDALKESVQQQLVKHPKKPALKLCR